MRLDTFLKSIRGSILRIKGQGLDIDCLAINPDVLETLTILSIISSEGVNWFEAERMSKIPYYQLATLFGIPIRKTNNVDGIQFIIKEKDQS